MELTSLLPLSLKILFLCSCTSFVIHKATQRKILQSIHIKLFSKIITPSQGICTFVVKG